ncbi:hypothetical protein [Burkholderia vietnamiensis]|uniref:hypothetical protein n=1 Tax=Burkholderia vietnamiensis TaxID=60552 RepID=UPI000B2B60D8|nr:hypothetical protein [Burkholderia vietnamiensis]MDN7924985.1 hypothetical protein [Burkholderia vietnamiensis]HDR9249058.1 hypothetical protein [Burkholderia vietnamiensis]
MSRTARRRRARRRSDDAGHTPARHAGRSDDASSILSILGFIDSDAFASAGPPVMPSRNVAVAQSARSRCSGNHKCDTSDFHTASPELRILGIRAKLQFEFARFGGPAIRPLPRFCLVVGASNWACIGTPPRSDDRRGLVTGASQSRRFMRQCKYDVAATIDAAETGALHAHDCL